MRTVVRRRLIRWGRPGSFSWERMAGPGPPPARGEELDLVRSALEGRALLAQEVIRALRGTVAPDGVELALAELAAAGEVDLRPGIEVLHFGRAICRRCGETELIQEDCYRCGDRSCWTCPSCREMGPVTGCQSIYARERAGRRAPLANPAAVFNFTLTPAQTKAADLLRSAVAAPGGGDFLIWAVCGAGKTEVLLTGLAPALARGDRILLATPRRDVALDLAARVARAYPGVSLAVHLGGRHEEETPDPAVTVATTHQCLRFYTAFDLVVLDEVDAFPYHGSRMLYAAVERARLPGGRLLYVTATPPAALRRRLAEGDLPHVRLPVRPHGHPLPTPRLIKVPLPDSGTPWRLPAEVASLLAAEIKAGRRVLVFVPTVVLAEAVGEALRAWGAERGIRAGSLHAADRERDAKRESFAAGRLDLLVTTTILERGLTLGALDVMVLYADHEAIFDEASLVQIAGRAGRTAADPVAAVFFLAQRISRAMSAARDAIAAANEEARREGFLTSETDAGLARQRKTNNENEPRIVADSHEHG